MRHFIRFIALAALLAGLTVSVGAATFSERQDHITQAALAYGEESYFGPLGIAAITVLPDVTVYSPGYIVAALRSGQAGDRVESMLTDLLLSQDRQAASDTRGLFPPERYTSAPSLGATCRLLPLLAWIVQHGRALPENTQAQARSSLELAYTAVKAMPPPPDRAFLPLLRCRSFGHRAPH